ncbi:MAG: HPP family protein [Vicinamibacterales bacterium]
MESRPHPIFAPIAVGVTLMAPAALAVAAHQVVLFASLGPSAVMEAQAPGPRSSAYSVVVSHLGGFAIASFVVLALGIGQEPSVFQLHFVDWPRAIAAVSSLMIATAFEIRVRAPHPPGAATTLLVALGSLKPNWQTFALVAVGVGATAATAEVIRRLRADGRIPGGAARADVAD